MAIDIITGFNSSSRESLDKRAGPYDGLATALLALNTNERFVGLKVLVVENSVKDSANNYIEGDLIEYIFNGGISDSDLVTRTYIEADITDLDKYTQAEVDTSLALKADQADVDTALALKADQATTYTKTEVDTSLALKADQAAVDTSLALKADQAAVDTSLALKADQTDVDTALALKADQAAVDTALALKADQTDVDTALALKADQTDVDTSLALKADQTDVDTSLALKADKSDTYTEAETDAISYNKVEFVESKEDAIATLSGSNVVAANGTYYHRGTSFVGVPEGEESVGTPIYVKYDEDGKPTAHIIGLEDWTYNDQLAIWEYNGTTWLISEGAPNEGGLQYLYVVNVDVDVPLTGWEESVTSVSDPAVIVISNINNEPLGDLVSHHGVIYQSPLVSSPTVAEIITLSQVEYNAIATPDASILYVII